MHCKLLKSTIVMVVLLGLMARAGTAGDKALESDLAQRFSKLAEAEAKNYKFAAAEKTDCFRLRPEPVLRWTNPVSGSIRGAVFIWTHDKRPSAIASIYKYDEKTLLSTEIHSLSSQPFRARRDDGATWSPSEGGVVRHLIPDGPMPSESTAVRQRQMRAIARQFSAARHDPDESERNLRLMSRPLFRYAAPESGVIDGAIFAFVQGTNPDVILLIEAIQNNASPHWRYGLARMHRYKLDVSFDGKMARVFPEVPMSEILNTNKNQPYKVFRRNGK